MVDQWLVMTVTKHMPTVPVETERRVFVCERGKGAWPLFRIFDPSILAVRTREANASLMGSP